MAIGTVEMEEVDNAVDELYSLIDFIPLPTLIFRLPETPYTDASHITHYANKRFVEVLGYDVIDIPNHQVLFQRAFPDIPYRQEVMQQWLHNLDKPLDKAGDYLPKAVKIRCKNREERWFKIYTELKKKIFPGFYFVTFCDNTCERENDELQKNYVSKDALTNLENKHSILKSIEDEVARVNRFGDPFSVIIVHLDNLGDIEKNFGSESRDYVLKTVAGILQTKVRKIDITARWDNDKFIILLPKANADQAYKVNELILDRLKGFPFKYRNQTLYVSTTMGIAEYHINENVNNTIARADSALYLGKEPGKGYIVRPHIESNYSLKSRFAGKL